MTLTPATLKNGKPFEVLLNKKLEVTGNILTLIYPFNDQDHDSPSNKFYEAKGAIKWADRNSYAAGYLTVTAFDILRFEISFINKFLTTYYESEHNTLGSIIADLDKNYDLSTATHMVAVNFVVIASKDLVEPSSDL